MVVTQIKLDKSGVLLIARATTSMEQASSAESVKVPDLSEDSRTLTIKTFKTLLNLRVLSIDFKEPCPPDYVVLPYHDQEII